MTIYDVPVDDTVFFPVSGDMLRLMKYQEENGGRLPDQENATAECQSQNDLKETEMTMTPNSTNVPAQPSPTWAVPAKRWQSGTDVMHQGVTRRLERLNKDGSEYHFEVELTQLEEVGSGFVTDPYFCVRAGGEGTYDSVFTVDIAELENVADWLCSVVEKTKA